MLILGLNMFHRDTSVALIQDGGVVFAIAEGWLNRQTLRCPSLRLRFKPVSTQSARTSVISTTSPAAATKMDVLAIGSHLLLKKPNLPTVKEPSPSSPTS